MVRREVDQIATYAAYHQAARRMPDFVWLHQITRKDLIRNLRVIGVFLAFPKIGCFPRYAFNCPCAEHFRKVFCCELIHYVKGREDFTVSHKGFPLIGIIALELVQVLNECPKAQLQARHKAEGLRNG